MNETFEDIIAAGGLPQEDEAVSVVGGEIGGGISGGGTFDGSKYALKNHTHKFKMPDNQTIRTPEILGGFIRNTEIDIKNATGKNIFNVKRTGANTGDVTIGNYSGGAGALWDYSAGVFDIKGTIHATSGEIGGWTIGATTLTATSITLDSGNERISVGASNPILIDGANKKIESGNYVSGYAGAGFHIDEDKAEFGNIACRGLIRSSVFQKDIISAMGGNFMVLDSDVLNADMTADDTETLTTKGTTTFSTGDILRIKDADDDEWLEVTAVNGNTYTVTRDKAGDYGADANPTWKKGATVVNYGQSGDGGVYMTASESSAPYLSVFTHSGSPWTDLTTRLRIGNLNGYLGYTSDKYGIGIGEADKYLKYDPTNGLRLEGCEIKTSAGDNRIEITTDNTIEIYSGGTKYSDYTVDGIRWFDATGGNLAAIKALRSPIGLQLFSYTSNNDEHLIKFYADTATQADFSPGTTNEIDLGTSSKKFKDLYIAGDAYIAGGFKGTQSFENIPTLPASDPTTDNQATRKAYVDSKAFDTTFSPENTNYFTYQLMGNTDGLYWQSQDGDALSCKGGILTIDDTGSGVAYVSASIPGVDTYSGGGRVWNQDGKVIFRLRVSDESGSGNYDESGFGFAETYAPIPDYDNTANCVCFSIRNDAGGTLYAHTANGSNTTNASISVTLSNRTWNDYMIIFNPGTDAKFYVNGVLEQTITTNLPTAASEYFFFAVINNGGRIQISPIQMSIEI